jgi:glyoxylase-like metal-dependent hydrolase (beta-lactamase superfamily II)
LILADGDRFHVGELIGEAFYVPGHTPACMAYRIGDALFVGDTLFMPDAGTARCDFPAAMPTRYISRAANCWHFLTPLVFMCVTITSQRVAPSPMFRLSRNNVKIIFI